MSSLPRSHHRDNCFLPFCFWVDSSVYILVVVPPSFWVLSFLGLPRPLVAPCFKPLADKSVVGAVLVTGLPLFFFSGPGPMIVSWGGSGTFSGAAVRLCVGMDVP